MNEVKQPRKPMIFYYVVVLVVMLILNIFITPLLLQANRTEVSYSQFISDTTAGNIQTVKIESNQIVYADKNGNIYYTATIDDPELVGRLTENKVEFASEIKREDSPIIDFISQFLKTTTNSDLDMTKHWENTIKMFEESGEDPNEIMVEDSWIEDNKEALRLVDAFQAVLQGMRVDNADYNNPTGYTKILNKVNSAIGNTDMEPLAEID
jgi:hypothetical protein